MYFILDILLLLLLLLLLSLSLGTQRLELMSLGFPNLRSWVDQENNIFCGYGAKKYLGKEISSIWVNPFDYKKFGREESHRLYFNFLQNSKTLLNLIDELDGKSLGEYN